MLDCETEPSLADLLQELQEATLPALADLTLPLPAHSHSREQPEADGCDMPSEQLEQYQFGELKAIEEPDDMLSSEIRSRLGNIWSGSCRPASRQHLFARSFHNQRRCIKSMKSRAAKCLLRPAGGTDWHCFSVAAAQGDPEELEFNQEDLDSLRSGCVNYTMVRNYTAVLRAANHFPRNAYLFPIDFLQNLLGEAYNCQTQTQEFLYSHIEQNLSSLESHYKVKPLDYDFLIFPAIVEKGYKLMVVQAANQLIQALNGKAKTNIIFCNFRAAQAHLFAHALRIYLVLSARRARNNPRLSVATKQIHLVYLMLPREFSHTDSGIYAMLYLEFLFHDKCAELHAIRLPENQKKLHLFPRSLAVASRLEIWSLFVGLEGERSEKRRMEMCGQFLARRRRCCEEAVGEFDYDQIEGRELEKFLVLHEVRPARNEQAAHYEQELNYYLDPNLNYFLDQSS